MIVRGGRIGQGGRAIMTKKISPGGPDVALFLVRGDHFFCDVSICWTRVIDGAVLPVQTGNGSATYILDMYNFTYLKFQR